MSKLSQYIAARDLSEALLIGSEVEGYRAEIADRHAHDAFAVVAERLGYRIERIQPEASATILDFASEIPALTSARRPDMSRKSRAEAVS